MLFKKLIATCLTILTLFNITAISSKAITSDEILENSNKLYNITWTPLKEVRTSIDFTGRPSVYKPGNYYHLPYGQLFGKGYYIGYDIVNEINVNYIPVYTTCITSSSFVAATKDINSPFYTQRGGGGKIGDCPYYGLDCSGFVSLCWNLCKKYNCNEFTGNGYDNRTSSRPVIVDDLGSLMDIGKGMGIPVITEDLLAIHREYLDLTNTTIDIKKLINYINNKSGYNDVNLEGYGLCIFGVSGVADHIVLIGNMSEGGMYYDIVEEIPYELTCNTLSLNDIFKKYQNYHLYRFTGMEEHTK